MAIVLSVLAFLTALITLFTTVSLLWKSQKTTTSIQEIHVLVNKQKSDLEFYQKVLINALQNEDIDVPENPNS